MLGQRRLLWRKTPTTAPGHIPTEFDRNMGIGYIVLNVLILACLFYWGFRKYYLKLKAKRQAARHRLDMTSPQPLITNGNESQTINVMPSAPTITIDSINETTHAEGIDNRRRSLPDFDNPPSYEEAMTMSKVDLRSLHLNTLP